MIIFSKNEGVIVNTNAVKSIHIGYDNSGDGRFINADDFELAEFRNENTARKVLQQIFDAMKNGEKTFELP